MSATDDDAAPGSGSRPTALPAFFDAWTALCLAAGRRSLYAASALEVGTEGQREALARALTVLGYPEGMSSVRALGTTLRSLRGRRAADGRSLARSATARGSIWYVVPGAAEAAA